jgi:hypothetical protein
MFDTLKNKTIFRNKYHTHSEAVIIACYFNSEKSPYRLKAFNQFYNSIKHLNYRIVECVIGDGKPELPYLSDKNISIVYTKDLLWHKETLLNNLVKELPKEFKYVFWLDADIIFDNLNWMVDAVEVLKTKNICQPFEYCVHLKQGEQSPSFNISVITSSKTTTPNLVNSRVWRSFCANHTTSDNWKSEDYNTHGHVGFAWGARREILELVPLYDRALIGGADHIIAHAAAGQISHSCIVKAFNDNIEEINEWSKKFSYLVNNKIGYVKGNLYHIWHGDLNKREYLKRAQEFTATNKQIKQRDNNGLHTSCGVDTTYVNQYFKHREIVEPIRRVPPPARRAASSIPRPRIKSTVLPDSYQDRSSSSDGFIESMIIADIMDSALIGTLVGGNPIGAMIGEEISNEQISNEPTFDGFDGGSSGGAGATGSWEETTDDNFDSSNTFS